MRVALAEDVARTPLTKAQWAALRAQFPELAEHQPHDAEAPLRTLLSWVPEHTTRTLYDQACRPILRVGRDETGRLQGSVLQTRERTGDRKTEHWDGVAIGADIDLLCGSTIESERGRDGRWQQRASSATGCATTGPRHLYKVSESAAWYGEPSYGLERVVLSRHTRRQACRDGAERTCSFDVHGFAPADGARPRSAIGVSASERDVDCRQPCVSSNLEAASQAGWTFQGLAFRKAIVAPENQHPTLFRTLEACRDYRARHPIAQPWSASGS